MVQSQEKSNPNTEKHSFQKNSLKMNTETGILWEAGEKASIEKTVDGNFM